MSFELLVRRHALGNLTSHRFGDTTVKFVSMLVLQSAQNQKEARDAFGDGVRDFE